MKLKHNLIFILTLLALAFRPTSAISQIAADELVSVTNEGVSKAASAAEASREIQARALSTTARDQVIEMIGEKRFAKNKSLVESRIVRDAVKFIPFVQPGEPQKQPDGTYKMRVDLKVSLGSLRKLILDAGLLTDGETPVTIFPMMAVTDRVKSVSFRWWLGDTIDDSKKWIIELSRVAHDHFQSELMKQGFHLLMPAEPSLGFAATPLPAPFRTERASNQDLKQIGEFLNVSMILRGDLRVKDSEIQLQVEVLPVSGGRTVAEVTRTFTAEAGPTEIAVKKKLEKEMPELARDLAAQVFEAWTRGTLAATTVKLAVRGSLTPKQMTEFRSQFSKVLRDIKTMRERVFEPGRVLFEIDYASSTDDFKNKLKTLELPHFQGRFVKDSELGEGDGATVPFTIEVKPKTL